MFQKTLLAIAIGIIVGHAHAQTPVCTVTPNKTTLAPNEVLILTAACVPVASSYVWTGPGIPSTTAVPSVLTTAPSLAGAYLFTVAGVNGSGTGPTVSTSVTVPSTPTPPAPPPPAPPPPGSTPPPPAPAPSAFVAPTCPNAYVEPARLTTALIDLVATPVSATLLNRSIFAWRFTPTAALKVARIEMTSDNYIDGKDMAISARAGDFAATLPNECVSPQMGSSMLMLDVDSTFAQQRCHLVAGGTYYINVRMSYPTVGSIVTLKAREYR